MRRKRVTGGGCDALDVAALWQSMPQTAGISLFDIEELVRAENDHPQHAADHGSR